MLVTRNMTRMADTRNCEQCGGPFAPRRQHARFCSARCRVAWNHEKKIDPMTEVSALRWSIAAMSDATERLPRVKAWDRPRASAVISEAVWWITIVDATLVRHYPGTYDRVLAGQLPAERRLIEETLAGLRFVRNRMAHQTDDVDFIHPQAGHPGRGNDHITAWAWKPVPEPALASLPPNAQDWEMTRYRAYQARLAGHTIEGIFGRAAAFLRLTANATSSGPRAGLPASVREHVPPSSAHSARSL